MARINRIMSPESTARLVENALRDGARVSMVIDKEMIGSYRWVIRRRWLRYGPGAARLPRPSGISRHFIQ